MIIDAHAHIAHWPSIKASEDEILESQEKYKVAFSLVSDCDCSEYPSVTKYGLFRVSQLEGLRQTLKFVKAHPERLGAMVWINPHNETVTPALKKCIEENRKYIFALKFHPFESHLRVTSPKLEPYFELMREFNLPMLVHTAQDKYSDVYFLGLVAGKNPDLKFVAAHMQLLSDNRSALSVLKAHENVYGDTAWVDMKIAKKVLLDIGEDKIMFGTDNPIDGVDTLNNPMYQSYYKNKAKLPGKLYHNLMYRNAINLYKLPVK
jgi:predicted TIM-barrel fold metal-dependent hydrolase